MLSGTHLSGQQRAQLIKILVTVQHVTNLEQPNKIPVNIVTPYCIEMLAETFRDLNASTHKAE